MTQGFFIIIYIVAFFASGNDIFTLLPIFIFNIIFIIAVIVNLRDPKNRFKVMPHFTHEDRMMFDELRRTPGFNPKDPNTFPPEYRQKFYEMAGVTDPQAQYPQSAEQPSDESVREHSHVESQPSEDSSEHVSNNKIEVRCISEAPNTSFALTADGRICGYIGNVPSTFDVPAGMHLTRIITNNVDRKVVFEKNIMFNSNKRITVKKKISGYSVLIGDRPSNGDFSHIVISSYQPLYYRMNIHFSEE